MDLYTAFMRTAARIEKKPSACLISETDIPKNERDYGCVLGWIAYEMGMDVPHADDVLPLLGVAHFSDFSLRMIDLLRAFDGREPELWFSSKNLPKVIRAYAEKYLQKPAPALDPALAKLLKGLDTFFTEKA